MTTLAKDTPRDLVVGQRAEYPMIASDIIYQGAAVGLVTGTGHAQPLTDDDRFVGFAEATADNSDGGAAGLNVRVIRSGSAVLTVTGVVITDVGQPVYATDDNAFTMVPTAAQFIGFVRRFVGTNTAEVAFDVDNYVDPYAGKIRETLAAASLTLDDEDNAKFIFVTADSTITLPVTSLALANVTLVCMGPYGTVQIVADPQTADQIMGPNLSPAADTALTNTKATAQRGDLITLTYLSHADGPCITEIKGTWA